MCLYISSVPRLNLFLSSLRGHGNYIWFLKFLAHFRYIKIVTMQDLNIYLNLKDIKIALWRNILVTNDLSS